MSFKFTSNAIRERNLTFLYAVKAPNVKKMTSKKRIKESHVKKRKEPTFYISFNPLLITIIFSKVKFEFLTKIRSAATLIGLSISWRETSLRR